MTTTCAVCELHAESTFRVEGMDCHEEVAILQRRLGSLRGLEALEADVVGQRLRIKYDAAALSTSAITEAVAQTGMRAWLETEQAIAPSAGSWRERLVVVSGVLFAAGLGLQYAAAPFPVWPLYLGSAICGGIPVVRRAWMSARARILDINVLMVIAVIGALLIGEWTEAASVVFLFALAQLLENRAMTRARGAISALMELAPADACVRRPTGDVTVPIDDIGLGETVLVRPGDKIPVDGRVVAGSSAVNQAPVTGESLPVDKSPGDDVFAGTINGRGALDVRVTHHRADSTIARIIHLVEQAQAQRAPSQAFIERFARIYTPAVLAIAVAVAILPPLLGGEWATWFYRSLVLLVISCPCALVISTPVSVVSALAAAARKGVLIKGGARLEALAAVKCVAFDKTGTLTRGRLHVTAVHPLGDADAEDLLRSAAALETRSEHPMGQAIARHAISLDRLLPPATDFSAVPGRGARGHVQGQMVIAGNLQLLQEHGLRTAAVDELFERVAAAGATPIFVARGRHVLGAIAVADEPRQAAREALDLLHEHGISRIAMLTGDNHRTAESVGADLGIDDVRAELLPDHKADAVAALRREYGSIAMVGDGVNDAPALASADVGIAMGAAGSAAALETADVALMADELPKISYAIRLSRAAARNIRFNIGFSLVFKAAFLFMAVFGAATLWMAVAADMGTSLLVIANALRLLRE